MALIISSSIFGQNQGEIKGIIADEKTKEPLIGATVQLRGTKFGSQTGINGNFSLRNVPTGTYTLRVTYIGFGTLQQSVDVTSGLKDLGTLFIKEEALGLEEVQIFADVVEERKTPVAITTFTAQQIDERFSDVSLAEAIQNTPGVFTAQGAGGYGDQEVFIRGFDQTNVAFLVNGIPVNDMENGRMFWSNFAGLSQVTRTTQVQRGLGASKLAVSSIGGTVNMITKPSDRSQGGRIEYQTGTGSWNNRLRFTYNSGESTNGWAFSFQGTRTTTSGGLTGLPSVNQGSIVPGAFTDAWSYYLSMSKKINDKHQLMFWTFGAPFNRGSAFVVDQTTAETFDVDGEIGNNALGTYRGELLNARQNKVHKPLTALTHYWDFNSTSSLTTSLYYSKATVYSVQPRDSEEPAFLVNRTAAGIGTLYTADNLINWDYLAAQNRSASRQVTVPYPNGDVNTPSITGFDSQYYLESRHNNHDWIGLVSNYTKQINKLRLRGGTDIRLYRGEHYAEVFELFDGDFILQENRFGDPYNKLDTENAIAKKGDKTNYNYDGIVNWYSFFGQAEWNLNKLDVFGSATLTFSDMQRIGYFWNGSDFSNFNLTSLGKSEKKNFTTYTIKTGVNYRLTGRHNIFANAGYFTRPPFLSNAFDDARYSNVYRNGLTTEKISSAELGYGYKTSFLKINVNAYYLTWRDRTTQINEQAQDSGGEDIEVIPVSLSGLVSEHKGLEMDVTYNVISTLELNGFVSLGDWTWKEAPAQEIPVGNGNTVLADISEIEGLRVGTSPQTTLGFGFHFTGIRSTYIGSRFNYADRIPIQFNPDEVASGFINRDIIQGSEYDPYYTVDLYAGHYFDIGDSMSGRLSISVQNVFDESYVRYASYFFNTEQRGVGFPRTYTIGLSIDF